MICKKEEETNKTKQKKKKIKRKRIYKLTQNIIRKEKQDKENIRKKNKNKNKQNGTCYCKFSYIHTYTDIQLHLDNICTRIQNTYIYAYVQCILSMLNSINTIALIFTFLNYFLLFN